MRILIAGGHKRARQSLTALLRASVPQSEIHEAADGREALRRAAEILPRLVILDVPTSDFDTLAVAREIRCRWPGTRILVLVLHPSHLERALAAEVDALVSKGEPPGRLLAVLSSLLERGPSGPLRAARRGHTIGSTDGRETRS